MLAYLPAIIFLIIALVLFVKILGYAYTYFFWGAIYVPTSEKRVKQMIGLLDLKSAFPAQAGKRAADLGAGDGRLVIALAKAGVEAHGYEINPFLVLSAIKNIKKAGLEGKAFMHFKNLWRENLGKFDIVALYAMKHMMKKLEKKLDRELRPGSMVVSNYFIFPKWKPRKTEDNIYLYIKNG